MNGQLFRIGVLMMIAQLSLSSATLAGDDSATILRIHYPKVNLILDPQKMEDAYSMGVNLQLYRGLMRYTPEGEGVPDLAQSWTESPDHLRYVFKLKSATFSDGKAITAKQVQMTFARMFFIGAAMGADLDYISGVEAFRKSGDLTQLGIRPISDTEVEFRLSHPSAIFLKQIAVVDCGILPLDSYQGQLRPDVGAGFSGPYRLKTKLTDQGVRLEKWRTDALDSPSPPKEVDILLTDASVSSLLQEGRTDTVDHNPVTPEIRSSLLKQGWQGTPTELIGETFLVLNPKFIAPEIRQHLASRVNPEDLLASLGLSSSYRPAYGLIPTGVPGELKKSDRRLPAESITLPSGRKARFEFEYEAGNPVHESLVQYLRKAWKAPGLLVEFRGLTKKEVLGHMFGKQCQACVGQKGLDYPDGFSVLGYFKSGYPGNYFYVEDPVVDEKLGTLLREFDPKKREAAYKAIQNDILVLHTVIPLFFGSEGSGLWGPKVKAVPSHPMGLHTLPLEMVEMKGREQ